MGGYQVPQVVPGLYFRMGGVGRIYIVEAVSGDGETVFVRRACFKGWTMARMYQAGASVEVVTGAYVRTCLKAVGWPQDRYQKSVLAENGRVLHAAAIAAEQMYLLCGDSFLSSASEVEP